ncbi:MAG TPA: hypothetical protein VGU01_03040 [Sphingomicrobium sp.]|nr:hypothetical protein [Sphingomicrobium sp.]
MWQAALLASKRAVPTYQVSAGGQWATVTEAQYDAWSGKKRVALAATPTAPAQPCGDAEQADEAVTDRLAKLLAHCFAMGMTYDRQSRVKVIRATFKINEQTSDYLQEQFALVADEFIENAAGAKDSK